MAQQSTIVGCFDSAAAAQAVERDLVQAGFPKDNIHLVAGSTADRSAGAGEEPGFWDSIKEAFGFADENERSTYGEACRRGNVLVSVETPEQATDRAVEIMRRHHAVDLDQHAAQWRQEGWTGHAGSAQAQKRPAPRAAGAAGAPQQRSARSGEEVIPVVEEELQIGKRQVQKGGVRVYSHVTEKPVEEQVKLREERVNVERRPADRPVGDADQAFRERTIEATETAEQAVVKKQARVVEEVAINKDVQERTETVRDKIRRTDVEVEQMSNQQGRPASFSSDAFVNEVSADTRYRGRTWDTMEPDLRRSFEQRYPNDRWDQHRDSIRKGLERRRGA